MTEKLSDDIRREVLEAIRYGCQNIAAGMLGEWVVKAAATRRILTNGIFARWKSASLLKDWRRKNDREGNNNWTSQYRRI